MLKFGPPDTEEAERLLRDAGRHLKSAKESLNSSRPAKALDDCQAAIEMAVKALFPLAGAQAPTKHGVGKMLHPLTSRVKGKKWAMDEFKLGASRAGWLNEISEKVHTTSRYGFLGKSASDIITSEDAKYWTKLAEEVRKFVAQEVRRVMFGDIKFA